MCFKKVLYRSLFSASAVITLGISSSAYAASGSTSVSVAFPEIIILHYRSALNITFTGAADFAIDEGAAGTLSLPLSSASGDGTLSVSGTTTTDIPVTVSNMWAVRGITNTGTISVGGSINTDTATVGGSEVVMSNLEIASGGVSGSTITVPSSGYALSTAVKGDVSFDLDISDVTQTGSHTGISYTITASAP